MQRASYAVIARLPTHTEYWYADTIPATGTQFLHRGERYQVLSCEDIGRSRFVIRLEVVTQAQSPRDPAPARR
jgi:hypothetical protein